MHHFPPSGHLELEVAALLIPWFCIWRLFLKLDAVCLALFDEHGLNSVFEGHRYRYYLDVSVACFGRHSNGLKEDGNCVVFGVERI